MKVFLIVVLLFLQGMAMFYCSGGHNNMYQNRQCGRGFNNGYTNYNNCYNNFRDRRNQNVDRKINNFKNPDPQPQPQVQTYQPHPQAPPRPLTRPQPQAPKTHKTPQPPQAPVHSPPPINPENTRATHNQDPSLQRLTQPAQANTVLGYNNTIYEKSSYNVVVGHNNDVMGNANGIIADDTSIEGNGNVVNITN